MKQDFGDAKEGAATEGHNPLLVTQCALTSELHFMYRQ